MSAKLRDFIRNIRSCRTAAEERAVIAKECALIRTAFKEDDSTYRHRNVAKLLFIHMMGYPTHFGQLECMKLIASPRFAEKRIGYLGLNQVLDENSELLMLVTNSIKNDLHHPSQYVNGLALCALGNMASPEMCRALAREVKDLCCSGNPYIRKKALLCAIRLVRKVEDMSERFVHVIPEAFEEKNHGILLCGCALINALVEADPKESIPELRKIIPQIISHLKRIIAMSSFSGSAAAEYDISRVTDPFLQVKLLRTLRLLQQGLDKPNDEIADILSQIASITESTKGAGHAVLLECAATIMAINPDSSLKSMGVSILGRFLQNSENNIRYIALSSLQQLVKIDVAAVQKHRNTILECVKDVDISIRRRAIEVLFHLVNEETIKPLFKELLGLLVGGVSAGSKEEKDFQRELVSKICQTIDRYSPSQRWQVDSLIRILSLAGNLAPAEVRNSFIYLLALSHELQSYSVLKLFFAAKENPSQEFLTQVAIWAIGEYGDLLVAGKEAGPDGTLIHVSPSDALDFLESCCRHGDISAISSPSSQTTRQEPNAGLIIGRSSLFEHPCGTTTTEELLITCLIKLSTRFPSEKSRIQKMLRQFETSFSVELQQRSCEYDEILQPSWDESRIGILDRMPVPNESTRPSILQRPIGDLTIDEVLPLSNGFKSGINNDKSTDLLDLVELLDVASTPSISPNTAISSVTILPQAPVPVSSVDDMLADLFGGTTTIGSTAPGDILSVPDSTTTVQKPDASITLGLDSLL